MSEIVRILQMRLNDKHVGRIGICDNGDIMVEFQEDQDGAEAVAFLVNYALTVILQGNEPVMNVEEISLN